MKLVSVKSARDGIHKYVAHFILDTGRDKHVKFGAKGYSDYTKHHDDERRLRYINRHKDKEDWSNPLTPGSLSRWILWEEPTLHKAVQKFVERFDL